MKYLNKLSFYELKGNPSEAAAENVGFNYLKHRNAVPNNSA